MIQHAAVRVRGSAAEAEPVAALVAREIRERCGYEAPDKPTRPPVIELSIQPGGPPEGFEIASGSAGVVRVIGSDRLGLLYGAGKLLRGSRFSHGAFVPGAWRGHDAPECPFRGIYFATHFHNFYHDAPIEDVSRYVEQLALWGTNALVVWFDMHHFNGFDDPAAVAMRSRLLDLLGAARKVGMKTGLTLLANEGYANSPAELRLVPPTQIEVRGMYGTELCPSKPGARELVLREFRRLFEAFRPVGLDYLSIWPYDQGGCGCEQCKPWGANGFLRMARPIAALGRELYPGLKAILSTWLFDSRADEGEWSGLTRELAQGHDFDYVMADSHTTFPEYPLKHGVPGGLPLLNFPEISMWGMSPWGGRGANPLPMRFQGLWDTVRSKASGGFPYSEGLYEDINKAMYARFYWKRESRAIDAVREYAAYEFGPDVAGDVCRAVGLLERNHTLPGEDAGSADALGLLQRAELGLTVRARSAWRWRILVLRAILDAEHYSGGDRSVRAQSAYDELKRIYHAEHAEPWVKPGG